MNGDRSFLKLKQPIVCCIMGEPSVERALATIGNAVYDGAQAYAIHLEYLGKENHTDDNLTRLASATNKPFMFLHYRNVKGTVPYTDEERVALLTRAVRCGATAIDFTADTFDPSPLEMTYSTKAIDQQKWAIEAVHKLGGEVIMSSHITQESRTCEQVLEQMSEIESRGCDIAKIVTNADTEEAFTEGIKTTMALRKVMKIPFIHLLTGRFAVPHRFISPTLGNCLTFCVQKYSDTYCTVQPPVRNMNAVLTNINWHI